MSRRRGTSREQWLVDAIATTRAYIASEQAEDKYDLRAAAPGSSDYDRALDSRASLERTRAVAAALEGELAERRKRDVMRGDTTQPLRRRWRLR